MRHAFCAPELSAFRDACGLAEAAALRRPRRPRAAAAAAPSAGPPPLHADADGEGAAADAGIDWGAEVRADTVARRQITVAMLKAFRPRGPPRLQHAARAARARSRRMCSPTREAEGGLRGRRVVAAAAAAAPGPVKRGRAK